MSQTYQAQTLQSGESDNLSQPTGYLLSRFGLLVLLALLLLAARNGQVVLVILLGLALSAEVIVEEIASTIPVPVEEH